MDIFSFGVHFTDKNTSYVNIADYLEIHVTE